jgi:hypothetical protein
MQFLTLERASVAATTIANYESSPSTIRFSDEFFAVKPHSRGRRYFGLWSRPSNRIAAKKACMFSNRTIVDDPTFAAIKINVDPVCRVWHACEAGEGFMASVVNDNTNVEGGTDFYFGIPGFTQGVIEDLSNVNLFYEVKQEKGTPLTDFTMRITVTDTDPVTPPPPPPQQPGDDDDGGCCHRAVTATALTRPCPALAAMGLVFFGLRRFKASK